MMKTIRSLVPLLLIAGLFAVVPSITRAQDDPPSRVGRLNFLQGSVSYQVSGQSDWVQADPNRPLTTGDNLWADKDSRGEVHIDSTAIRLSSETGLSFLNLDDRTVQLQLPQGTIEVHLRQLAPGDAFEIDTPNLAFTLTRPGEYVIATDPNGSSTSIIVREGEGEVTGGGDSWDLRPGQQYAFQGTDQLAYDAQPQPDYNDFEAWCQTRDQRENNSASARYVSRDVDGYYDLDDYGDWSADPDYGQVWYPRGVAADWAPYHTGHWVYIAPWGWTWVDGEPWGFAPFHYGRWALFGGRWGWVPGPVVVRPVYAPALVGFVGGAGFGLSVSIGGGFTGVAWFPLGPRDVFVPAYHCSPRYVQVINVTNTRVVNVTQVTNVYNTVIVNRDVTHVNYTYGGNVRAVTAVSRDTFVNARSVDRESVRINDTQIRDVHVVAAAPIAPMRTSYVSANAKVAMNHPAVPFSQRPVVANLQPRVPVQVQHPQGNNGNNNGFHSFQPQGNNNRAPNGGQPDSNQHPTTTNNNPPQNGQMNNGQGNAPANNTQGNNNQNNNGFRPFGSQNNGNRNGNPNAGGTPNGNQPNNANQPIDKNGAPASNANQQDKNNQDQPRYRFNPPTRAKDDNYDVHPPLNQNGNKNQGENHNPPPAQQPQNHEEHHDSQPQHDNNKDSKDKSH